MRISSVPFLLVLLMAGAAGAQVPLLELDRQNLAEEAVLPNVQVTVVGQPFHFFAVAWSPSNSGLNVNGVDFQLGAADTTIIVSGQLDGNGRGTTAFDPNVGHDTIHLQAATASDPGFVNLVASPPKTIQIEAAPEGGGLFFMGGPVASSGTTTLWGNVSSSGQSGSATQSVFPTDCAASDLLVSLSRTLGAGESITVTLRDNDVDTTLACTVVDGSNTCDTSGNMHTFAQGQRGSLRVDFDNVGTTTAVSWGFLCN